MNKEEKRKTLFSSGGVFVDIFIGFLIAACIAGIVYRCFIYDPHVTTDEGESYMIYFEIEDAHPNYAKYLESGDTVYNAEGLRLGALAVYDGSDSGDAVSVLSNTENTDTVTVRGVMRSRPGVMEQGTLVLDGVYQLTPGQTIEIYTDTVAVTVRILKITDQAELPVTDQTQQQTQEETEAETTEAE